MLEGLTTLLAVLVGGVLTYLVQARLDERRSDRERERDEAAVDRERERENEAAERELRVAKRLVAEEVETVALHHALLVRDGRYPGTREREHVLFPDRTWTTYKPTLALGLDDDVWETLSAYMYSVPRARSHVGSAEPGSPIDPAIVEKLRESALVARELHETLTGKPTPSVNERGEVA